MAGERGSPTSTRSRTSAAARTASRTTSSSAASRPRASSSPSIAASRPSTSPRRRPRSSSRTASASSSRQHAVPTQMSSYEVVERGAAAGIVITASHNPWVDNGFKVKAPTGSAAGPDILTAIEARLAENGGQPIERRPLADAEAAGLVERFDPFDRLRAVPAADDRPRCPEGRRRPRPGRPDVGRRRGLDQPAARRRHDPRDRDPPGAQPLLRWRQSRAHPAQHRRGAGHARGRRLRPRPAARRRRRPGGRRRRARHVHPPAPGDRPAHVLPRRAPRPARARRRQRQQHLDGGTPRQALRHRRRTRPRSGSSSSARR